MQYWFFHIRPAIMLIILPICIFAFNQPLEPLNSYYNLVGIFLIVIGLLIFIPSHWAIYKPSQWLKIKIHFLNAEPNCLVTNGFYGYIRNPILLGTYLVLAGETLIFSSLPILTYFIIVFIASATISVLVEEKQLLKTYKSQYIIYKKRVARFIPKRQIANKTKNL